jgi:hypothetical protein
MALTVHIMSTETATDADQPRVRQLLATLHNHHVDELDDPLLPVDDNDDVYVSTFMTSMGEQLLYLRRKQDEVGYLFMGDLGWERRQVRFRTVDELLFDLDDAKRRHPEYRRSALNFSHPLLGDVHLSDDESSWLWMAWRCGELTYGGKSHVDFLEAVTTYEAVGALIHAEYFPLNGLVKHPNTRDHQIAMGNFQRALYIWQDRLSTGPEDIKGIVKATRALVDADVAKAEENKH